MVARYRMTWQALAENKFPTEFKTRFNSCFIWKSSENSQNCGKSSSTVGVVFSFLDCSYVSEKMRVQHM